MKYLVLALTLASVPLLSACGKLLWLSEDCRITAVNVDARKDERGNQVNVYDYLTLGSCGENHVRASYNLGTSEAQEKIERATSTETSSFNCANDPWLTPAMICTRNSMLFNGTAEFSQEDINDFETARAPLSTMVLEQIDRDTLKGQLSNALKRLEPDPIVITSSELDEIRDVAICRACGVARGPVTNGAVTAPAPNPAPNPAPLPLVQNGASGELVEALQYLLRQAGAKDIVIDGDFGDQTDAAVRDFQKKIGLAQDGKVGPQTWGKLWVTVRKGASQRDAVRAVQVLLNWQGKDVAVDGDFGDQTEGAVRAFQTAEKLSVDGIVGPATWGALVTK